MASGALNPREVHNFENTARSLGQALLAIGRNLFLALVALGAIYMQAAYIILPPALSLDPFFAPAKSFAIHEV